MPSATTKVTIIICLIYVFYCYLRIHQSRTIAPSNSTAVYSPVQASCNEETGVATLYVNDPAAHQIVAEDKPSFRLQRNNIIIGKTLLEGTFGSIFHATLQIPGIPLKDVIVKTVKSKTSLLITLKKII